MTVYGVDCSDFDWGRGRMDVAAMVRDGIRFLTHKATEGTRTVHTHYGEALSRAKAAGVPVLGAYVVPRTPGNGGHGSVAAQAEFFLSHLDSATPWWRNHPAFFLQVDLEKWSYDEVSPAVGVALADQLVAKTGKRVILYAPKWAYGDSIPGSHPLWASGYGSNPASHYAAAYPGDDSARWAAYSGRAPVILQYGSKLTVGSQPGMDGNAFRGTLADLLALASAPGTGQTNTTEVDVQLTDTVPQAQGRNVGQVFSDLWNEEMNGHSGFVATDKTQRQQLLEEVRDNVRKVVNATVAKPAAVTLSDADRSAIAAEVTAALGARLDQVLARLAAAGQALDG